MAGADVGVGRYLFCDFRKYRRGAARGAENSAHTSAMVGSCRGVELSFATKIKNRFLHARPQQSALRRLRKRGCDAGHPRPFFGAPRRGWPGRAHGCPVEFLWTKRMALILI